METRPESDGGMAVLRDAVDELEVERRRIVDEISAFESFERVVCEIEPDRPDASGGGPPVSIGDTRSRSGRSTRLETVRSAYERTVMSVPHFAEDYNETYAEHLQQEFGSPLAAALVKGPELTDWSKEVLLSAVADARSGRESMQEIIDRERASVTAAVETLRDVRADVAEIDAHTCDGASFGTLEGYRESLLDLETRCERDVARRQETIVTLRRRAFDHVDASDFLEYLYRDRDVEYPVVSAYTTVLARIESVRCDVERHIAYASQ